MEQDVNCAQQEPSLMVVHVKIVRLTRSLSQMELVLALHVDQDMSQAHYREIVFHAFQGFIRPMRGYAKSA
jgi:hypothetical protein